MRQVSIAAGLMLLLALAGPAFSDCVSCGPGGDCYTTSPGFSGNCECKIRSVNGVSVCRPSGICDPNDANTCEDAENGGGFPIQISSRFVTGLAEVNPLLAGAAWAGVAEANATRKNVAEVKGTMGQNGKSFTYTAQSRRSAKDSILLVVEVKEDSATGAVQRFEGTLTQAGKKGRFVEVGPKARTAVFAWGD